MNKFWGRYCCLEVNHMLVAGIEVSIYLSFVHLTETAMTELYTVNCGAFLIQHELFLRFMPRVFRKIYHKFAPYALICKTGDHSFISQIIIYYLTINRYQLYFSLENPQLFLFLHKLSCNNFIL